MLSDAGEPAPGPRDTPVWRERLRAPAAWCLVLPHSRRGGHLSFETSCSLGRVDILREGRPWSKDVPHKKLGFPAATPDLNGDGRHQGRLGANKIVARTVLAQSHPVSELGDRPIEPAHYAPVSDVPVTRNDVEWAAVAGTT